MFKKDKATPLVTLDDETLLQAEKESRKTHKKHEAAMAGSAVKVAFVNPFAVIGIAKNGIKGHHSFWTHQDIYQEIVRRNLTPLPETVDEKLPVLIGGQLVGIAAGEAVGSAISGALSGAIVTAGAQSIHNVATNVVGSTMTNSIVEKFIAKKAGDVAEDAVKDAIVSSVSSTVANDVSSMVIPSPVSRAPSPRPRTPILGFLRKTPDGGAHATEHLSGQWVGWAEEKLDSDDPSAVTTIKYRLKFELNVSQLLITGKSLVDGCEVEGTVEKSGLSVTLKEFHDGLPVDYECKVVGGGKLAGTWSSGERHGVFSISHI